MATLGTYSAGETAAYGGDRPLVVSHNALRDSIDARWTTTGTQAGTDLTEPLSPTYRAWDGRASSATRFFGTANTVYFNVEMEAATIDTFALIFLEPFPSSTVTVQIADDGDFDGGSNVETLATFTGVTGIPRLVRSFNGDRYDAVEFIRVIFERDAGDYGTVSAPRIAEFFAGRGRILSIGWALGSDMYPIKSGSEDFEARSGDTSRYIKYYQRHEVEHEQDLSASSIAGLNDAATVHTWAHESNGYTRPVLYIPNPATSLNFTMLGLLQEGGLDMPRDEFDVYSYEFEFKEQPMFRGLE